MFAGGILAHNCWNDVFLIINACWCLVSLLKSDMRIRSVGLQAVEMFLDEKIGYMDIVKTVEQCCDKHQQELLQKPTLDEIVHYDQWARDWVSSNVGSSSRQAVAA